VARALESPPPSDPDETCERAESIASALEAAAASRSHEGLVARWWQSARGCDDAELSLLDIVTTPPVEPALRAALLQFAANVRGDDFERAWELLDDDSRATLSPQLVLDAADHEVPGIVAFLAQREAGRAELRRRLASPEFVLARFEVLDRELPQELWPSIPLDALEGLATVAVETRRGLGVAPVLARLVDGPCSSEELGRALTTARTPAWRFLLASSLRARGVRRIDSELALPPESADWTRALALPTDDVDGALALLEEHRRRHADSDLSGELALLTKFTLPAVLHHATPAQLYSAREGLDNEAWRTAWHRLSSPERVELLERFQLWASPEFVPESPTEAKALWRLLQRSEDFDALKALLRSLVGFEFVRRQVLVEPLDPFALEVRERFARTFGLTRDTLTPRSGGEAYALLSRLCQLGLEGTWSAADVECWQRLRLLRGL